MNSKNDLKPFDIQWKDPLGALEHEFWSQCTQGLKNFEVKYSKNLFQKREVFEIMQLYNLRLFRVLHKMLSRTSSVDPEHFVHL